MMQRRDFVRLMAAAGLLPLARTTAAQQKWPARDDPHYWRWIRAQFDVPADEAYFNVGTLGSRPRQITDTVANHMREIERTIAQYDYRPEHPEYIEIGR